jgi:hypothetical protein
VKDCPGTPGRGATTQARLGQCSTTMESDPCQDFPVAEVDRNARVRRRMNWNLVYGGSGCVLVGIAALFLTKAPRSGATVGFGIFALTFGLACVLGGAIRLARHRT